MAESQELTQEEKIALRRGKFAPLPPPSSSRSQQPRLAHPGGPLKTNKAAALARFLERKLQDPNGLSSINPDLVESAVRKAKDSVSSILTRFRKSLSLKTKFLFSENRAGGTSSSGRIVHHVASFGDSEDSADEGKIENLSPKKHKKVKKKKQKKKNKKTKDGDDSEHTFLKKPKKKLKL